MLLTGMAARSHSAVLPRAPQKITMMSVPSLHLHPEFVSMIVAAKFQGLQSPVAHLVIEPMQRQMLHLQQCQEVLPDKDPPWASALGARRWLMARCVRQGIRGARGDSPLHRGRRGRHNTGILFQISTKPKYILRVLLIEIYSGAFSVSTRLRRLAFQPRHMRLGPFFPDPP